MFISIPLNEEIDNVRLFMAANKVLAKAAQQGIFKQENRQNLCLNISIGNLHDYKTETRDITSRA